MMNHGYVHRQMVTPDQQEIVRAPCQRGQVNGAVTYGEQLATLVGEPEATRLLCEVYVESMDQV